MPTDPSQAFARLVTLMAVLRGPDGCPWDREQTFESLGQYVLEEAYEVVDAIEGGDLNALREEIGDHIFEAVFLAQIASELGAFTVGDALQATTDKLVRRHPHVFQPDGRIHDRQSRERAPSAEAALSRWDEQKAVERASVGTPDGALTGLPKGLPALLRAYKLGKRAASAGFDWIAAGDVIGKIEEEIAELSQVVTHADGDRGRAEEEMGDVLFSLANLARKLGIDPEAALRKANDKFAARFSTMESRIRNEGSEIRHLTPEALEARWQEVKRT